MYKNIPRTAASQIFSPPHEQGLGNGAGAASPPSPGLCSLLLRQHREICFERRIFSPKFSQRGEEKSGEEGWSKKRGWAGIFGDFWECRRGCGVVLSTLPLLAQREIPILHIIPGDLGWMGVGNWTPISLGQKFQCQTIPKIQGFAENIGTRIPHSCCCLPKKIKTTTKQNKKKNHPTRPNP